MRGTPSAYVSRCAEAFLLSRLHVGCTHPIVGNGPLVETSPAHPRIHPRRRCSMVMAQPPALHPGPPPARAPDHAVKTPRPARTPAPGARRIPQRSRPSRRLHPLGPDRSRCRAPARLRRRHPRHARRGRGLRLSQSFPHRRLKRPPFCRIRHTFGPFRRQQYSLFSAMVRGRTWHQSTPHPLHRHHPRRPAPRHPPLHLLPRRAHGLQRRSQCGPTRPGPRPQLRRNPPHLVPSPPRRWRLLARSPSASG